MWTTKRDDADAGAADRAVEPAPERGRDGARSPSAAANAPREPFLARVGRACHDHRWRVVAVWVVALVAVLGLSGALGSGFTTKFSLPDVESAKGFDVLDKDFGGRG